MHLTPIAGDSPCRSRSVQLTYHLSERVARKIGMKSPNVYFRANNLLTLAPEKEKLLLNIGAEPAYTWFALGFKANF